jgi:hypothetical protein
MLRTYFRFNRDLLKDLCHLAHECLLEYLRTTLDLPDGLPGIVMGGGEDRTNKLHFCPGGGGQECRIMGSYVNISGGGSAWPGSGRPGLGSDLSFSRPSIACGVSKW